MQSPKFRFLKRDLQDTFDLAILKEEWKKRTLGQVRKQILFDALEYRDISENIDGVVSRLRRDIIEGTYAVHHPKRFLTEKSRGLCRQMTLVHPRDLLVLERLARSIYFELKQKAPSSAAFFEPDDGSFIKGFKQSDFQYGSFASWKKFQKAIFGFARENRYIVVTDVANFFDFINFQHLRNIISSLADLRESILDLLIYVLNRLTWTPDFMPLSQVGMPQIETSATRVLANAMLYEVDKVCEDTAVQNYARFMDDMDIGVRSISAAKIVIRDVDLTLQSRQLRLNSSKTKILSQKDAFSHFCIEENAYLARLESVLESGRFKNVVRVLANQRYEDWLQRGRNGAIGMGSPFRRANGAKIHKYVLKIIYASGGNVDEDDLVWLIKNEPGMRSTAFRYLATSRRNNNNLSKLVAILKSGVFIDDASLVDFSGYLLHSRFRKTAKCERLVRIVCDVFAERGDIGLHSSIFVASKFLGRQYVLDLINNEAERISADFWLSRAVGGVAPLFAGTADWGRYVDVIERIDNSDARDVFEYHEDISAAQALSQSQRAYFKANNPSFPQRIYFPKVLMLLSLSKNPNVASILPDRKKIHPAVERDGYFRGMGF